MSLFPLIQISGYVEHNDAILLVIVPASQASEISTSQALKLAKEYDAESKVALELHFVRDMHIMFYPVIMIFKPCSIKNILLSWL